MKKVTVKASATSANLGGGFDCLGLALKLYNGVTVEKSDRLVIESDVPAPTDASNLIYKSMNEVFRIAGVPDMPVKLTCRSDIPQASGLGSSAACIVCGVTAANALVGDILSDKQTLELCVKLDGHPDNVLPALVGGVTAGVVTDGGVEYVRTVPHGIVCVAATPDFPLETKTARAVLPNAYSRADCVYSLSRAALVFGAFAPGKPHALKVMGDRLHEPYRIPLVKDFYKVSDALKDAGALATCLSGAGPTVLAFFKSRANVSLPEHWTARTLEINENPVEVTTL